MFRVLLLSLSLSCPIVAKDIPIPKVCQGPVCLTNIVWKKGFTERTLSGVITTRKPISSVIIDLSYGDGKTTGSGTLRLRDIASSQAFYGKVYNGYGGIKWERLRPVAGIVAHPPYADAAGRGSVRPVRGRW